MKHVLLCVLILLGMCIAIQLSSIDEELNNIETTMIGVSQAMIIEMYRYKD